MDVAGLLWADLVLIAVPVEEVKAFANVSGAFIIPALVGCRLEVGCLS